MSSENRFRGTKSHAKWFARSNIDISNEHPWWAFLSAPLQSAHFFFFPSVWGNGLEARGEQRWGTAGKVEGKKGRKFI